MKRQGKAGTGPGAILGGGTISTGSVWVIACSFAGGDGTVTVDGTEFTFDQDGGAGLNGLLSWNAETQQVQPTDAHLGDVLGDGLMDIGITFTMGDGDLTLRASTVTETGSCFTVSAA
jgi:hypothetical protein